MRENEPTSWVDEYIRPDVDLPAAARGASGSYHTLQAIKINTGESLVCRKSIQHSRIRDT